MTIANSAVNFDESRPGAYVFGGREVRMPVEVRDACAATVTYLVSAEAARRLLPKPSSGPELEIAEVFPGRALFSLTCIDYRDNDLGDYDEVSLSFFVRPKGEAGWLSIPYLGEVVDFFRQKSATWIYRLPVNQQFTRDAGAGIWGFPKTVEQIDFQDGRGQRTCRLYMDGRHVLTLSVPSGGAREIPDGEQITYTFIDGILHRTRFEMGARGVGFSLGGGDLTLGDHPISEELRSLGLPSGALMTVWMEHQHGRFGAPQRV